MKGVKLRQKAKDEVLVYMCDCDVSVSDVESIMDDDGDDDGD